MKSNQLQSDDITVPIWEWESSRLILKVWQVWCCGGFSEADEIGEELEENDDKIDNYQVPSLINSKL